MQPRRLRRSRRNRWLVGVCGGFGERYGFPPIILRLALIAAGVFFTIPALLAYLIAWLLIPEEPLEVEPWPPYGDPGNGDEAEQAGPAASSELNPPYAAEPQHEEDKPSDPWAR